jgi:23S rRNA (cytidine1920-2'-O)/16S rRNA (cytidine1409-2'-O)-methyltransferase
VVQRGLAESGAKAQALILAGRVKAPGLGTLKPGLLVAEDQVLELLEGTRFVSRGGEKLEGPLKALGINPAGRACMEVGASTGGFTDCLLQHGAEKVFSVDVGTGQLHWKLRNDPRVSFREKTHILHFKKEDLPFPPSLVVVDVSFISLEKVLPHLAVLTEPGTEFVVLVKPQFEAGPKGAPGGVVRDPKVRAEVLARISEGLAGWGFRAAGDCPSPLPGPEGNLEHFLHFFKIAR